MSITLNESADYVQNAVHDGTLKLVQRDDHFCCESPWADGDYGVCGNTAFVIVPSQPEELKAIFAQVGKTPEEGQTYRKFAFCLHCAADYLRGQNYRGRSAVAA
jgi:hypothetical protein